MTDPYSPLWENRAQVEQACATARGFASVQEMRDAFSVRAPRNAETRSDATTVPDNSDNDDYRRRLRLARRSAK